MRPSRWSSPPREYQLSVGAAPEAARVPCHSQDNVPSHPSHGALGIFGSILGV